jgi:hypothetical protein
MPVNRDASWATAIRDNGEKGGGLRQTDPMSYDLALWADVPPFAGLVADEAYDLLSARLRTKMPKDDPATVVR